MALSTSVGFPIGHTFLHMRQTDDAATHGQSVACSGAVLTGDTGNDFAITVGGTAGVTPKTITIAGLATEAAIFMESGAVGLTTWHSGVWNMALRASAGNANITLEEVHVCRVNSAGVSQGTVASRTALGRVVNTGTGNVDLFQENDVTATATDRVYVVVVLANANAGSQDITIVPDQMVTGPAKLVHHVVAHRQRAASNGKRLRFNATATFLPPTVETIITVAAPTFVAKAFMPNQIKVDGPVMFRTS